MAEPSLANPNQPVVVLSESAARKTAEVVMQAIAERPASGTIPTAQSHPMQRDVRWLCKSVGEISAESTGSVKIYSGDTEGSEVAMVPEMKLRAYNRSTTDIPDDTWVYIEFLGGMANTTWSIYSTATTVALKEGLLDGDLAAPEDGLTSPTTAVMSVHEFDDDGDLVDSGDNITITNRDETLGLSTGDFVIVTKFGDEYRPVFPSGVLLLKEGLLDGDLAAPEDGLTSPTTAVMSVHELNVAGNLVDTGDNITITNRDETLELSTGDFVIVTKFGDEYRPVFPSSASSELKEGLVDGDLEAPEDGLTSPTTAVMSVHELNVSGDLVDSGDNVTITNRDEALKLSAGDFVIVTKFGDEYRPIYPSPSPCDEQNEIQIINVFGQPTGGTFDLVVRIDGVSQTIEFDYNLTAGEVEDQLETHTNISYQDVLCTGGPLPDAAIKVEFRNNLENTDIPIMMPDHGDLTGGEGRAVLVSVDQHGRS